MNGMTKARGDHWLVTGGAGYIGAHVVAALRASGHRAVVIDDLSAGVAERIDGVPLVRGSVLDEELVFRTLQRYAVGGVIHLAARKQATESVARPLYYYQENVDGLRSVLAAMQASGVDRIVYTSSAAVYGETGAEPIGEDEPCRPLNPYGETKLIGEWLLRAAARTDGLRYVALRYFNVAGASSSLLADRAGTNLLPLTLQALAAGRRPMVFGTDYPTPDGTGVRDYIHVADIAAAHVAVLGQLQSAGCALTFNVGSGRGYSVLEVLSALGAATGTPIEPEFGPRRPGDAASVVAGVDRIRRVIGFEPRLPLAAIAASEWQARTGVLSTVTG
jgi:UDP-glucose 4-epimerase